MSFVSKMNPLTNFCLNLIKHNTKSFSTRPCLCAKNHYDALGITKGATQGDVKSAYYKLSMQYHPDHNEGCEVSAQKFRDITEAYEVLGNYRLRKLYDKGMIHTVGTFVEEEEEPDIAHSKFHKSRQHRSKPPPPAGRTPIFDFDEWSRAHYQTTFRRRDNARKRYQENLDTQRKLRHSMQLEMATTGMLFCILGLMALAFSLMDDEDSSTGNINGIKIKRDT